jgi:hypothetical protein
MSFSNWLDLFLSEKGIDLDEIISVEGDSGQNLIPVGCLVDVIKSAPDHEQRGIKAMMVRIDFQDGRVIDYLRHLAQAIAR